MSAILKPRTRTVKLLQGDEYDRAMELQKAIETVALDEIRRRVGDSEAIGTAKATADFNEFMEAAEARGIQVTLTAMGRKAYRALLNEHPPRIVPTEDNPSAVHEDDAPLGFNIETFGDDLLMPCITSIQTPEGEWEEGDVAGFIDGLSDGQFNQLFNVALDLNAGQPIDPKVRGAFTVAQTSDETSSSPARLG
ncbi:MAG: hypothetical protein JWP74_1766 [Marmoricola sp.]|nr:hypothetical protein [Marmoricola sp.]